MNKVYIPIHTHDSTSLLDGASKIEDIPKRAKEIGSNACGVSNHGTISGSIKFLKECKKGDIKPILGCELYIADDDTTIKSNDNRSLTHLLVYAKNDTGWKNLLKIIKWSNDPERFYYKPRISLKELTQFSEGLICLNGHLGTSLSKLILNDDMTEALRLVGWFKNVFGDNFFLEGQPICNKWAADSLKTLQGIRKLGQHTGIPVIATADAHYVRREDAIIQRILLCKNLNIKLSEGNTCGMSSFFLHDDFHIPTYEEMIDYGSTEEELGNTNVVASLVEEYKDVLKSPILPEFKCPNNMSPDEYLRQLCREGWNKKIKDKVDKHNHQVYIDRIKRELDELQGANLSSYFLILHDIVCFVKNNGWLVGPGRGSCGGCLTAYLIDITKVDPIEDNLLFERFWNSARKGTMPDIDIDIPKHARDTTIEYIKEKYGKDKVGQIATFGTMKGRGALKDVMRAYDVPFEEVNKITKLLPEPAKIAGELEEMKQEEGVSSVIKYALENDPKKFQEYVFYNDDGELEGMYAEQFKNAIRCEGIITSVGKHACGIVVAPTELHNICPMIYDSKTKTQICGLDLDDVEAVGGMKLDLLGLSTLDRLMGIQKILACGEI
jgi:DNA polymerase-3 subunit alpha